MKVLFIQHTSVLGGSSKSLLEIINNLPSDVISTVLCPKGKFSDLLDAQGIKVVNIKGVPQFDNTKFGYYRKHRWLILLREFFYLPFLFLKILELKKEKFDIVHINEITQIYSIVLSKHFLGNTVVHVRSMQSVKKNFRYKVLLKILKKYGDTIIAIDKSVKSTLDTSLNVKVIHNGMSLTNINRKKNNRKKFTVGIVANFLRYKGIVEYIDAANICINKKGLDIDFVVFGASYSYQNTKALKEVIFHFLGFRENLDEIIKNKLDKYKLTNNVKLEGYVYSSDEIYNNIDLLTFPSHLNAAGRPVFEAAFYNIPSIVAIENEFDDTIINNITGICIKEKDSDSLANAIEKLYYDNNLLLSMGEKSSQLANTLYNSEKNAKRIYELYKNLLYNKKKERKHE